MSDGCKMIVVILMMMSIFSIALHGMEDNIFLYKKLKNKSEKDFELYCSLSKNLNKIIDVVEESRDGGLMARLIQYCIPRDIIKKCIAPYLSETIAVRYKQDAIAVRSVANSFNAEAINFDNRWRYMPRHDGTYSLVPIMETIYAMWVDQGEKRKHWIKHRKEVGDVERISVQKQNKLYAAAVSIIEKQEKGSQFYVCKENSRFKVVLPGLITHYVFSHEGILLAFGGAEGQVALFSLPDKQLLNKIPSLSGAITVLCSAHSSPAFVVGSNQTYTRDVSNLMFIKRDKAIRLNWHDYSITCAEFSPDDSRLLTCSYNKKDKRSCLKIWKTADIGNDGIGKSLSVEYQGHTKKAFFICNGKYIVAADKKGYFNLFDGITCKCINTYQLHWRYFVGNVKQGELPLFMWTNTSNLLIHAFDSSMIIRRGSSGRLLGRIPLCVNPVEMGITADEKTIIFMDENNKVYQLLLYDEHAEEDINFIKNKANIVQLYAMLDMCKNKNSNEAIKKIKLYIEDQQIKP